MFLIIKYRGKKKRVNKRNFLIIKGAEYGNRTRLCGLGSDHSTDELTLRGKGIIADCPGNFNTQFAELFRRLPRFYFLTAAFKQGPRHCVQIVL